MSAYTAAPWDYDPYGDHISFATPAMPEDYTFRIEFDPSVPDEEELNLAHLIAAAPELLEACKRALEFIKAEHIEEHGNTLIGKTWGALETVIAKAEGGKP